MKLLALDTATEACSAALLIDGEVRERFEIAPRDHARLLLPMAQSLLDEAGLKVGGLDAIAFGRGPGSFTGVRIAASITQGVAFAASLPVIPVSSLAALAQGLLPHAEAGERLLAAIDARMDEVYWGAFTLGAEGLVVPSGEERVVPPDAVPLPDGDGWFGVGTGWGSYGVQLAARLGDRVRGSESDHFPRAAAVARLAVADWQAGRTVAPEFAIPVYLRDQVAKKAGG